MRHLSLLQRVCSRMDVHNSAPWTRHRYGDEVIHHAFRGRERGMKDQEDCVGVLDVFLPLGGGHWRVLIGPDLLRWFRYHFSTAPLNLLMQQGLFLTSRKIKSECGYQLVTVPLSSGLCSRSYVCTINIDVFLS